MIILTQSRFQRQIIQPSSDVENETKSGIGFSTLHNVDTMSDHNVKKTSKQRCTELIQCCINVAST